MWLLLALFVLGNIIDIGISLASEEQVPSLLLLAGRNLFLRRQRNSNINYISQTKSANKSHMVQRNLRIPQGKQLRYVHMGYGSIDEKEIILTFENGKLTKENIIDNTKKRLPSELEGELDELQKSRNKT